jgi:hypothetical protein
MTDFLEELEVEKKEVEESVLELEYSLHLTMLSFDSSHWNGLISHGGGANHFVALVKYLQSLYGLLTVD